MKLSENAYIDLHMHTTTSDGTDTPAQLIEHIKEKKLDLFSVTDHDAVDACRQIRKQMSGMAGDRPAFITGTEFSCKDEGGNYHILGYGYDMDARAIRAAVRKGHDLRIEKTLDRLDFLNKKYGFTFPQEELDTLLSLPNPGKPHIGNLMTRMGYAESKEDAIEHYINKKKFPEAFLHPEEAIGAIIASGGIPVLAHPIFGDGRSNFRGEVMEQRLKHLVSMGLQGVEAYYSGFSADMTKEMIGLADAYDLYITAGSDYHGTNKPVKLGNTGLKNLKHAPDRLHRFVEDVEAVEF